MRALFVALTRPTRRLVAVHAQPLPPPMVQGLARARRAMAEGPTGAGDPIIEQTQFHFEA